MSDTVLHGNVFQTKAAQSPGGKAGGAAAKVKSVDSTHVRYTIISCLVLGAACVLVFAAPADNYMQTVSISLLAGAGALVVGGMIGFLFGIPRALEAGDSGQQPTQDAEANGEQAAGHRVGYSVNTNLQQISDWLTKILVGVTLTQVGPIYAGYTILAEKLGGALQAGESAPVFAGALLIYFLVGGFLLGYLGTRIYLPYIFADADLSAVRATQLSQEMKETISTEKANLLSGLEAEREAQQEADTAAFEMVDMELSSTQRTQSSAQDIMDTVAKTSREAQEQIFQMAREARQTAWRYKGPDWRHWVARTVPVFDGLLQNPAWATRHRAYAQLGYALKDGLPQDLDRAEQYLRKAIALSTEAGMPVSPHYSFNWALCAIALEMRDHPGQPDGEDLKQTIVEALQNAVTFPGLHKAVFDLENQETQQLRAWMEFNGLALKDLEGGQG